MILSNFPTGGGGTGGGLVLAAVSNIQTMTTHNKVYIKWTDPDDMVMAGTTLAAWGGTVLIRKAGSPPMTRRDGDQVLDSRERNKYKDQYFCDEHVTDGVVYYYKFFPYTTSGAYTDDEKDMFTIEPSPKYLGNVSGAAAIAAGNGKLAITWSDPEQTVEENSIVLARWGRTTILVNKDDYATSPNDEADFKSVVMTHNSHTSVPLIASGLENGETYYISIFPTTDDGVVTVSDENRCTGIPNRLVIDDIPSQKGSLTYNGETQVPEWNNYDTDKMTLNVVGQENAGDYWATFTPMDDYCWEIGDIEAKQIQWIIGKKQAVLTSEPPEIHLDKETLSAQAVIGGEYDGVLSIETSGADGVFDVQFIETTIMVSSIGNVTGSGTITVKCTEGRNYKAAANLMIPVVAQFFPVKGKALEEYTWAEISQVSAAGLGDDYWDVGDTHSVVLKGTFGVDVALDTTLYAYILGFDHNQEYEGRGIHFGTWKTAEGTDVCLVDRYYGATSSSTGQLWFNMNHNRAINYGGWASCDLRYDILGSTDTPPDNYNGTKVVGNKGYDASATTATNPVPNTLMDCLPVELRKVMQPMTKYTDNTGNKSTAADAVTKTIDYLPLLAVYEIFVSYSYVNPNEATYQKRYDFFVSGNPTRKYRYSATDPFTNWWERSPCTDNTSNFCCVYGDGRAGYSYAPIGLAPVFKI